MQYSQRRRGAEDSQRRRGKNGSEVQTAVTTSTIIVIGGGAFGVAAALELNRRGSDVTLVDPGPLPHPLAASTDISKFVRMDYGADDLYTDLGLEALDVWDAWNATWPWPPYRETGLLLLSSERMRPGAFESDSYDRVSARGVDTERLLGDALERRFPAWSANRYVDGYRNPRAGWSPSGRVVEHLVALARDEGVRLREGIRFAQLLERDDRIAGIVTTDGERLEADTVVVAAGAWTSVLLPHLADRLDVIGQPVFHLRPDDPALFRPEIFPCWTADIARTGWYGFPANDDGIVKIANHGPGRWIDPDGAREVTAEDVARLRAFLDESLPSLADAPVAATRLCLYGDSWDGNFLIDRDPDRPGLVVAAGDSGHGFKFVPLLGRIIADAVEGRPYARFAWRTRGTRSSEHARFLGEE
ncbi:MAG: FAD-dependent oxidoreductase [Acidobacteria bacterium]|nr:FAD-dependent oxidoreductase [Acidobacteriota bacterium]